MFSPYRKEHFLVSSVLLPQQQAWWVAYESLGRECVEGDIDVWRAILNVWRAILNVWRRY